MQKKTVNKRTSKAAKDVAVQVAATVQAEKDRIQQDVAKVLQHFAQNEQNNRVTAYNMAGLGQMLAMAVDGKVQFPEQPTQPKPPKDNGDE